MLNKHSIVIKRLVSQVLEGIIVSKNGSLTLWTSGAWMLKCLVSLFPLICSDHSLLFKGACKKIMSMLLFLQITMAGCKAIVQYRRIL